MLLHQGYSRVHGGDFRCCVPAYPPVLYHRSPQSNNESDDDGSTSHGGQHVYGYSHNISDELDSSSNASELPLAIHPLTGGVESSPDLSGAYHMGALISTLTQPSDSQLLSSSVEHFSHSDNHHTADTAEKGDQGTNNANNDGINKSKDGESDESTSEEEDPAEAENDNQDDDDDDKSEGDAQSDEDEETSDEDKEDTDETRPPGTGRQTSRTTSNPTVPFPSHEVTEAYLRRTMTAIPDGKPICLDSLTDEPNNPSTADTIKAAIWGSENKRLTSQEIYDAVRKRFPHWDRERRAWRSNIRHNLTLKSMFVKVKRKQIEPEIGNDWMININMGEGYTRKRGTRKGKNRSDNNRRKSQSRGSRQSLIVEDPDDVVLDESDPSFSSSSSSSASTHSSPTTRSLGAVIVSRRQSRRAVALTESREIQRTSLVNDTVFPSTVTILNASRGLPNPYQYFTPSTNSRLNSLPRRATAANQAPIQQRGNFQDLPHSGAPGMRWDSSDLPQIHPLPPHTDSPSVRWDVTSGGITIARLPLSRTGYQQVHHGPANRGNRTIRARGSAFPQAFSTPRPGVWIPGGNIRQTDSDSSLSVPPRNLGQLEPVRRGILRTVRSRHAPPTLARGDYVQRRQTRSEARVSALGLGAQSQLPQEAPSDDNEGENREDQDKHKEEKETNEENDSEDD